MRKAGLFALLAGMVALGLAAPAARADSIAFSNGSGGGLITYDETSTGVMVGTNLPITRAFGTGSTSQAVTGYACGPSGSPNSSSCGFLQFTTGMVVSNTAHSMSFSGGQLSITGSVGGSALVTLLTASFVGPVSVNPLTRGAASGSNWVLTSKISVSQVGSAIVALFPSASSITPGQMGTIRISFTQEPASTFIGLATETNILIVFRSGSSSSGGDDRLQSSNILSSHGPVSPAPEPGSILLLGSGLVAVRRMLRRRKSLA